MSFWLLTREIRRSTQGICRLKYFSLNSIHHVQRWPIHVVSHRCLIHDFQKRGDFSQNVYHVFARCTFSNVEGQAFVYLTWKHQLPWMPNCLSTFMTEDLKLTTLKAFKRIFVKAHTRADTSVARVFPTVVMQLWETHRAERDWATPMFCFTACNRLFLCYQEIDQVAKLCLSSRVASKCAAATSGRRKSK